MKNNKIKVILLVAGEGKRLRPYTLDRPKCMVEIDGVSLLDRQLKVLYSEGLHNILMIGGYKSDALKIPGINLKINPKYFETNMVWTLFSAESELEGEVIISYGDIVYSSKILQNLLKSTADIAVAIDMEWESYWRSRSENIFNDAETLKLRDDGSIIEIGKRPKSLDEIGGQYMGLIKLSAKGVSQFKDVFNLSLKKGELQGGPVENAYMTDLLQELIDSGKIVTSVPMCGDWVEVDTVEDLKSNITRRRLMEIL